MSDEVKLLPCDIDALRYVLNFADSNTRVSTVMKTFTLPERRTTKERLERIYAALTRPTTLVTDEAVERVEKLVRDAYEEGVEDGIDWQRSPCGEPEPQWIDSVARVELIRHNRASMPTVVTGEQSQDLGDHALPPSGLSQSSLSQAKPSAAIARKDR